MLHTATSSFGVAYCTCSYGAESYTCSLVFVRQPHVLTPYDGASCSVSIYVRRWPTFDLGALENVSS